MFENLGLLRYYRAGFQVSVNRITGPHLVAVRQDSTVKSVLSDHIKQDLFVAFRTGDDDSTVSSILSGLETRSLGLNTLGTTWSPASSQSVRISRLSTASWV